jgi:hypothetical protein
MATNDQYAEMRVIRNSLSTLDKDLYLNFSAGANSKTRIYSNNVETMLVSGGNVGIGTNNPVARLHILEATGTIHGANTGSIIIDHENSGGASSITFRSKVNRGSDYAYIQYQDAPTIGAAGESGRLIIGIQNEVDDHIQLMPSGNVGVNVATPAYKLDVGGTIGSTGNITAFYSDERLKTITEYVNDVLPILSKINVFRYNCNDLAASFGYDKSKKELGLSAQEIQKFYPEVISIAPFDAKYDKEAKKIISKSGENYLTLDYERLVPVLIQGIKELNNVTTSQNTKISELEDRLAKLEKIIGNN